MDWRWIEILNWTMMNEQMCRVIPLSLKLCLFYAFLVVLFTLVSCANDEQEILRLAQIEYDRKMELIRRNQQRNCIEEYLVLAESIVDSLILQINPQPLSSYEYAPYIPQRPAFKPPDSTILNSKNFVKPIIDIQSQDE